MLEISEYRYAEAAAKAQIRSWWIAQTHHVDHFEKSGFPVRPSYFFEIGQLLDTMQENRCSLFIKELEGLNTLDLELTINALVQSIEFQLTHFPRRPPLLPISTMLSSLALYKKVVAACAQPRVLEVGPGCGYLSFFLSQHAGLREYAQVEAAESFYLLQNRVNAHCFGSGFLELAHQFDRTDYSFTSRTDFERGVPLDDRIVRHVKCTHFPWWMLGLLHERGPVYDVVTANANLNEFSRPALKDYLSIFRRVLKSDGVFIVQCTGFTAHGTLEDLFDHLHGYDFAPVLVALAGQVASPAAHVVFGDKPKEFALNNLLLVREGHALFRECNDRRNFANGFAIDADLLKRIYTYDGPKERYTDRQLASEVARVWPGSGDHSCAQPNGAYTMAGLAESGGRQP
jgi:hypothetical protein